MVRFHPLKGGLSLLEVIISTFLVGLVLLVASQLFRGYSTAIRHSQDKDREVEIAQSTIERLCSELSQATTVTPGLDSVTFQRLSPTATSPTSPLPVGWNPRATARMLNVTYELVDGNLDRVATSRQTMATGLGGFSVTTTGPACQVTLSVLEQKIVRVLTGTVYRWPRP